MEVIQSKENSLYKYTKRLKDKKFRSENKAFLVEGFRFVKEALFSDFQVSHLFISEEISLNQDTSYIQKLIKGETTVLIIKNEIFKALCSTETPQGILAVVKMKEQDIKVQSGLYVLCDKIQDPGNMGVIIRTAHAAGAVGVIYTKGTVDTYNEKTLRSTMGSIFHIPLINDENNKIVKSLKDRGFRLVVSSLDTPNNFFDVDLGGNIILCVGNEGNGVSDEILSLADIKLKIPMPGGAESLNASVAASIMIYEILRQKLLK